MTRALLDILSRLLAPLGAVMSRGFGWLYRMLAEFFAAPLSNIIILLKKLALNGLNISAWLIVFEELFKKLFGWLGVIGAVSSGAVSTKQIFDFATAVINPQEQMLDWLSEAFSYLPSLQDIVAEIDATMLSVTSTYFTPPLTLTYLLQVTGIGECFNQYLQALISTLVFVFSVFIIRWAFANNFTFTRSVPR